MAVGIFRADNTEEIMFGGFSDGSVSIWLYILHFSKQLVILWAVVVLEEAALAVTRNVWQSLAYSPLRAVVSSPSKY